MRCAGEHRSELDEEKNPCRAVQGEVGKHSGESEAYTHLAGGWKEEESHGHKKIPTSGEQRVWSSKVAGK